jgi:hypothetical protein
MASIDAENWMTDVLDYKTRMVPAIRASSSGAQRKPLKYYAAIV